jgi:hypothetical protein
MLRGNSVTATFTTPTVLGSYADPRFTVDFDVEVVAHIGRLPDGKVGVTYVDVVVLNSRLRGSSVTGTVGLAIADVVGFVGGPNVRSLASKTINGQHFSQSLNVALAPVSFRGNLNSTQSAEGPELAGQNALGIHPGTSVLVRFTTPPPAKGGVR